MKIIVSLIGFFLMLPVYAAVSTMDEQINLSQAQLDNLGIKLANLEQVQQIPLLYAPAKVVIPPAQEYIISAAQAGLVTRLYAAIGDQVTKGQVLATINSPELLTLQRQFLKAQSERNLAWASYQRDKKLFEEGIISERRWQETRSHYNSLLAEADAVRQLLEIAGVAVADIKKLAKTRRLSSLLTVRAAIDGVVLDRKVVAGERINVLEPLYRIANLSTLWLEINIPQEQIDQIKLGDQALISNSNARAKISLISNHVNIRNQTILVRAIIAGRQSGIRAGQSVNTQIVQTSESPVFKIANSAIIQKAGRFYVFIRTKTGFLIKAVEIIGKDSQYSIINGDFNAQQQVAVKGSVALKAKWMGLGEGEGE